MSKFWVRHLQPQSIGVMFQLSHCPFGRCFSMFFDVWSMLVRFFVEPCTFVSSNPELLHQLLHQPLYWPCHSCMVLRVPFQFLCLNMFDMFFCCIYVMQQVLCRRHNIFVSTTSGSSNIHPPAVELGPPLWWLNGLMCAVVPSSNFSSDQPHATELV